MTTDPTTRERNAFFLETLVELRRLGAAEQTATLATRDLHDAIHRNDLSADALDTRVLLARVLERMHDALATQRAVALQSLVLLHARDLDLASLTKYLDEEAGDDRHNFVWERLAPAVRLVAYEYLGAEGSTIHAYVDDVCQDIKAESRPEYWRPLEPNVPTHLANIVEALDGAERARRKRATALARSYATPDARIEAASGADAEYVDACREAIARLTAAVVHQVKGPGVQLELLNELAAILGAR